MEQTTFINNKKNEHILLCLSSSPSNEKIINTAAKMVKAFGGSFSAIYVQTSKHDKDHEQNKKRLQYHMRYAQTLGANIVTVYGDDIAFQIAEFARISEVTQIVIGRSYLKRRRIWNKKTISEKLTELAPMLDVHIIPDSHTEMKYRNKSNVLLHDVIPNLKDLGITFCILIISTLLGTILYHFGFNDSNIIPVYILGVLLTSLFTRGYICCTLSALISVILFNFFFTQPYLTLRAYDSKYVVTFAIMLIASIITGTLASKLKLHAKLSAQTAYRTKVLFETNQLLQKAQNTTEIFHVSATQLMKLLNRNVIIYELQKEQLTKGVLYSISQEEDYELFSDKEYEIAKWVSIHKQRAGAYTNIYPDAKCLYMLIAMNQTVYGVIGIPMKDKPLDSFEMSILQSILGECALALDNNHNAKEKEKAAVLAKNEQLRANLLRTISHDLRTPLTSISGNASNLLTNNDKLDDETRLQTMRDIYDDSQWLINLVENLLSITRIEEGKMHLNLTIQLMDEVIEEALRHLKRAFMQHDIQVEFQDELLLAKMDAKLIVQVFINLLDNAIKYTPKDSQIKIVVKKDQQYVSVSVEDNGPGIDDEAKEHVFDMFYCGNHKIADARRSLGLGLFLCKSIIHAHNGEIYVSDNIPKGSIFTFKIPIGEDSFNE